jgi:hypothetical protein
MPLPSEKLKSKLLLEIEQYVTANNTNYFQVAGKINIHYGKDVANKTLFKQQITGQVAISLSKTIDYWLALFPHDLGI